MGATACDGGPALNRPFECPALSWQLLHVLRVAVARPDQPSSFRHHCWHTLGVLVGVALLGTLAGRLWLGPKVRTESVLRRDFIQTIVASGRLKAPHRVDVGARLAANPAGSLHIKRGDAVLALLRGFNAERGSAVVVVIHNVPFAQRYNRTIEGIERRITGSAAPGASS